MFFWGPDSSKHRQGARELLTAATLTPCGREQRPPLCLLVSISSYPLCLPHLLRPVPSTILFLMQRWQKVHFYRGFLLDIKASSGTFFSLSFLSLLLILSFHCLFHLFILVLMSRGCFLSLLYLLLFFLFFLLRRSSFCMLMKKSLT